MIGLTSEITDGTTIYILYPQMKQTWYSALIKDTSWIRTLFFRLRVWVWE